MSDKTGTLTIVFNGEIYNFRDLQHELTAKGHTFASHCDTEVILAAYREWGVECLSKLNGMFAFALFDVSARMVFLARDRAGEKPLFYAVDEGARLTFASELKAMMADPARTRQVDSMALDIFLSMGYVPGANCILQGVQKLPPAHAMTFSLDNGDTKVWQYWRLPPPATDARCQSSEAVLLSELETLLEDAVTRQLTADVPVGVLLSGGVDSSLITALAVRASSRIKTFTVGFPGFGRFDETKHARLIANHFGTEHVELNAGAVGPELLPTLARQYDEPIVDSSIIPTYLVSRLVRQHCTVAIGGDGGDELFGGYLHYNRLLWTNEKLGWIPPALGKYVALAAKRLLPSGFRGRNWLQSLESTSLPLVAVLFDDRMRARLMRKASVAPGPLLAERFWESRVPQDCGLLSRMTRMDFENYMPEDILVKIDRASMLNSLELRAPMLDFRVIEFAFGKVPSSMKVTTTQRKVLLKKLAQKLLPPAFNLQRKQGFSIPLSEWLHEGKWRDYFHEVLLDGNCVFEKKAAVDLLKWQDRGYNNGERLFGLVMFELWRREYKVSI